MDDDDDDGDEYDVIMNSLFVIVGDAIWSNLYHFTKFLFPFNRRHLS